MHLAVDSSWEAVPQRDASSPWDVPSTSGQKTQAKRRPEHVLVG